MEILENEIADKLIFIQFANGKYLTIKCKAWAYRDDEKVLILNRKNTLLNLSAYDKGNVAIIPTQNVLFAIEMKDMDELTNLVKC
jgi:hypothetical protein